MPKNEYRMLCVPQRKEYLDAAVWWDAMKNLEELINKMASEGFTVSIPLHGGDVVLMRRNDKDTRDISPTEKKKRGPK